MSPELDYALKLAGQTTHAHAGDSLMINHCWHDDHNIIFGHYCCNCPTVDVPVWGEAIGHGPYLRGTWVLMWPRAGEVCKAKEAT